MKPSRLRSAAWFGLGLATGALAGTGCALAAGNLPPLAFAGACCAWLAAVLLCALALALSR